MSTERASQDETREVRPVVFSMGDPHGIGPEVVLRSLAEPAGTPSFRALIFGSQKYLAGLAGSLQLDIPFGRVQIVEVADYEYPPRWGTVSAKAGAFALESLAEACRHCRREGLPLLVTPPIHKGAAVLAGMTTRGQTEYVASFFPGSRPTMAFFSDSFHLLLVTVHMGLREIFEHLSTEMIVRKSSLFFETLQRVGILHPKVAVCGLNPHASESGLFGDEEAVIIEPAIRQLVATYGKGAFHGPLPADTVFRKAVDRHYDGVVALYHDQGLAPLKTVAFRSAVNVSLGLPLVRTSPAHGTAFEIAGKGTADSDSMKSAILWGTRLARVVPAEPRLNP